MKMGSSLFWGLVLIIIGISLVIKIVFNIDFPIFKLIIAFVLIYLGIRILTGRDWLSHESRTYDQNTVFSERSYNTIENNKEYNVVFGKSVFRIPDNPDSLNERPFVKINTVFGETILEVPKNMNIKIDANAAFSDIRFPNGDEIHFGPGTYENKADSARPNLSIEVHVVFGSLKVVQLQ
jgi:predicted membrane protein